MAESPMPETAPPPEEPERAQTREAEPYFVLKIGGFSMTAKQVPARFVAMIAGVAMTAVTSTPIWNR